MRYPRRKGPTYLYDMIKELRSWFLNRVAGQEALFSKERKNNKEGHRVFKDGDYPDEDVFRKLFSSVIFGLEASDRAKATGENSQVSFTGEEKVLGGHVTIATDTEAKAFSDGTKSLYTRTIRPSQNNECLDSNQESFQVSNLQYSGKALAMENKATASDPRNKYAYRMEKALVNWLSRALTESTVQRAFSAPYPQESIPSGLDSLPALPVGSTMQCIIAQSDLSNPNYFPKGRWLVCDGRTLGHPNSNADLPYSELKALYILLKRMEGRSESQAESDYNSYSEAQLPNIPESEMGGMPYQYIIRY